MVADSKDHLTGILEMSEMDHVRFFRLTKLPTCGGVKGPRIWVGSFVWCVWINPGLSSIPNWWSSSLRCGRAKSQVWGVCSIFQLHPITNEGDFWGIAPCRTAKQARRTLPVERKKPRNGTWNGVIWSHGDQETHKSFVDFSYLWRKPKIGGELTWTYIHKACQYVLDMKCTNGRR